MEWVRADPAEGLSARAHVSVSGQQLPRWGRAALAIAPSPPCHDRYFRWAAAAAAWAAFALITVVFFCFLTLGLRLWLLKTLIVTLLSVFSS